MRIARRGLMAAAAALLAGASAAQGADSPGDGRGQGNPGQVGKPGENKSGSSTKDSARDSTDKAGERGVRSNYGPRN